MHASGVNPTPLRSAIVCMLLASCSDCRCDSAGSRTILPEEVADEEALAAISDWRALPTFAAGRYAQQSSEDRRTGAPVELALWDHGNRDFNNFVCRGARADTPAIRVPFVFDQPACPESHVEGLVMARFEGSGRLARFWFTALSIRSKAPDDELIRIYVDDDFAPRIQVPLADMLGSGTEIFAPPFGAGSFRYVAWYYPLVFSKKLIITLDRTGSDDLYFHQTDVVLDETPRQRAPAQTRLARRDGARDLLRSGVPETGAPHLSEMTLHAGEPQTIELTGPATVVRASVRVPRAQLAALGDVQLYVSWDDQPEPAIALALADLFAAWGGAPVERSSLALSAVDSGSDVELVLALPMPFEKRASWTLENAAGKPDVTLSLDLALDSGVPSGRWGRLHTQRNETGAKAPPVSHPIADAAGPGRLVGVCADLHGHGLKEGGGKHGHPFHFLEGDETITIDGERRAGGTGTEDYFNGAFYFQDGASATPFAQAWGIQPRLRGAPQEGHASACRWHVLGDAIDFASSLEMSLEIGPGVPDVIDRYRSVAYLYR